MGRMVVLLLLSWLVELHMSSSIRTCFITYFLASFFFLSFFFACLLSFFLSLPLCVCCINNDNNCCEEGSLGVLLVFPCFDVPFPFVFVFLSFLFLLFCFVLLLFWSCQMSFSNFSVW